MLIATQLFDPEEEANSQIVQDAIPVAYVNGKHSTLFKISSSKITYVQLGYLSLTSSLIWNHHRSIVLK